jgi:uncharacterized protein (TIGR02266 family)
MSAPEFCREIRNDDITRTISLLLVCERENSEHKDLCLSAGCNDVIFRPLQRLDLDSKVQKLTTIPSRRQLRTLTKIDVSFENNGRFVLARSVNVSATGMLLETDRLLPADTRIRLHFYLPADPKPVEIYGHVMRAEFVGTMAKYGVRFVNPSDEDRDRIERFVHRLRARELI